VPTQGCWPGGTHVFRRLPPQEAHTLLSAGTAALSHLALPWPFLVPVHDALRDAYRGAALTPQGSVIHFDTDSLHTSVLPERFTQAVPQLEMFASRLRPHCPEAAALCAGVAGRVGDGAGEGGSGSEGGGLRLRCVARCCYEVPDWPQWVGGSDASGEGPESVVDAWDRDATWRPWAAQDDPIGEWVSASWARLTSFFCGARLRVILGGALSSRLEGSA
jgi:hypothetical protein